MKRSFYRFLKEFVSTRNEHLIISNFALKQKGHNWLQFRKIEKKEEWFSCDMEKVKKKWEIRLKEILIFEQVIK